MADSQTRFLYTRFLVVAGLMVGLPSSGLASVLSGVAFEQNQGQMAENVRFATRSLGHSVIAYDGAPAIRAQMGGDLIELRLRFLGGDADVTPTGESPRQERLHVYRGDRPEAWRPGMRRFSQVRYEDIYPGIDAVLHERQGRVELDFEVEPGVDPTPIALGFEGADRIETAEDGTLLIRHGADAFRFSAPEIYQSRNGLREMIPAAYRVEAGTHVEFAFAAHDESRRLVIDPVFLGFSTRLGGSANDSVRDVTTDAAGNIYLTGSTTSTDFAGLSPAPTGSDVFVAKLDPTGQTLLYVSFFGGDGFEEAWAVEADAAGNAYVAGSTSSTTFPTLGGYDSTVDGTDAFVLKLDPSGALLYGTVYGGGDADGEFNGGLGVHLASGRVYIGSRADTTNLPTLNPFSTFCPNAPCSFIAGFDPAQTGASSLVYASYLTAPSALANQEDGGILDLGVDSSENLYAFGFVNPNSQVVLAGQGFQDASGDLNNNDHVLVKLDPSASGSAQRVYSTFIGGFGDESERGRIAVLDSGVVYVGSKTDSAAATFPILNALQPVNAGGEDGYVAKVDTTIAGPTSQLWTTFLGSIRNDEINAVTVDAAGNPWVAATVSSSGSALFPQVLPLPGAPMFGIDGDAAVSQLAADGTSLLFSSPTVAGASAPLQAIAVQPSGRVILAGSRGSTGFPLKGGLELTPAGGNEIALVGLDPTDDLGLVLEASVTADPATTGEDFAFQYLVRNLGIDDAANAILTSDYPAGVSASLVSGNCSFPGSSATCDFFEDIPRGGNAPVYLVSSAASDGSYSINGSVSSDLPDPSSVDDDDSTSLATNATGSYPATLVLADFDAVAATFDIGGFAIDTSAGVLATPNATLGDAMNLMVNDGGLPFHIESLLGQGEVAFGFVDNASWTPSSGDGSDLFGRDFNAAADRVFAIVDADGRVELRTAAAFDPGRVIDSGFVPLGRPGLLSLDLAGALAEVRFDGVVVASGDPYTSDFRDAAPGNVGDDFVISVGFGTEDRGAAVLNVPEPTIPVALAIGLLGLAHGAGLRSRKHSECIRRRAEAA